jgi:hypothetical protein
VEGLRPTALPAKPPEPVPKVEEKQTPEQEYDSLIRYAERHLAAREKKGEIVDPDRAQLNLAKGFKEKGNMEKALKYARRAAGQREE